MSASGARMTGKLSQQALPAVLTELFAAKATGVLELTARAGKHEVFVREGYPVAVTLPGSAELIGKVLVEMKMLDEATYRKTLVEAPPKGQRYGDMLLEKKLVTPDQLRLALKAQVRRKLHRLFFLEDADFVFTPREHEMGLQEQESLKIHPARAIYHGVRSAWNAERLNGALAALAGQAFHCTLDPEGIARYGLGADDGAAGELLRNGWFTAPLLAETSRLPAQAINALLYALNITRALETTSAQAAQLGAGTATATVGAPKPVAAAAPAKPAAPAAPRPSQLPPPTDAAGMKKQITAKASVIEGEDLFQVLGLEQTATKDDVKKAYFDAAKRFHPDRLGALGLDALRPEVEKIFRRVSEAHATLSDDKRREEYRASLEGGASKKEDAKAHAEAMRLIEAEMAFRRGEILLRKNDFGGAVREFEQAFKGNPHDGEHLANLTWAKVCAGQMPHSEAQPQLKKAIEMSPRAARSHLYLGMCLNQLKQTDKALEMFKKALNIDAQLIEAEREIRLIQMRKEKESERKSGGFFFGKKK